MIERFISNELSLRRWRTFKSRRTSMLAIWCLLAMTFFSVTAEYWANSRPLLMKYHGRVFYPATFDYYPSDFGISDAASVNYRTISLAEGDYVVWPIVKWDPFESNMKVEGTFPSSPSWQNPFGTDDRGRDVLTRLLYGFRYSMGFAILTWFTCSLIGIVLGAIMGFAGGWTDLLGQRVIEVMESMPQLLLLITIISILQPTLVLLAAFTTVFGWIGVSTYIRAEFLKLRKREFVEAAKALGGSRSRTIFKHILPNSLTPWITMSPFLISGGISTLAALDFLGFGLPPPTPSWGELLQQAYGNFIIAWWLAVYPSLALFITLVMTNLIGEGVRDALDPRRT